MSPNQSRYESFMPKEVWSQILPRLWQGGTDDDDTLNYIQEEPTITLANFDTVITLHAWSNPADWHVREIRQPFHDGEMSEVNFDDLRFLVDAAYRDWQAGKRVLVRCLSGLNRSGLVLALVLVKAGMSPHEAIEVLRKQRHQNVLCNPVFAQWLREINIEEWKEQVN